MKNGLLVVMWKKEKKRKSKALGMCLKPLFCMASHNCKLKNTEGKKEIQGTQKIS